MTNLFSFEDTLSVVLLQCEAGDPVSVEDIDRNIEGLRSWMDWCARAYPGADLVVFPECCVQGSPPDLRKELYLDIPGQLTRKLSEKCEEHKLWAVFNFLETAAPEEEMPYNTSVLFNHQGEVVLKQHKINPFLPSEASLPGEKFSVCEGPKGAVFGFMTCYDGDFPEVARQLASMGANILLRPSSYMEPYSEPWDFVNRSRAYENLAYVIAVNRTGISWQYNWFGGSMAVNYDGSVLARAPKGAVWAMKVDIDPKLADRARKNFRAVNHLYNLKHRGYAGKPPEGSTENPYPVYRDWK